MGFRKNTRNHIQIHETKSLFVYLYEFRVNVRHPTSVLPLKSTYEQTYKHTYKFIQNPRQHANTGYFRSINATHSTCVVIER